MRKIVLSIAVLIAIPNAFAQWECRSKLAASLRPIGTSNFSVGNELITSSGYLSDNFIHNSMVFGAIDYTKKRSTFFVEGAFKYWLTTAYNTILTTPDDTVNFTSATACLGLREAFYQYSGENNKFVVGLHSAILKDHYLLNERIVGAAYNQDLGKFNLSLTGGSVARDFARNGSFCSVRYLYDIFPGRPIPRLGSALGETNFAAATFIYSPNKKVAKKSASVDEFSSGDEFSSPSADAETKKNFSIESLGLVAYREISDLPDSLDANQFGIFSTIKLMWGFNFEPEVLFQTNSSNQAVIYSLGLSKSFIFSNNNKLVFDAKYVGLNSIDSMALPLNSFSNLLVGEVIRLDAMDIPLYQFSCKYTIPKIKAHLKLQTVSNVMGTGSRDLARTTFKETDIEIGKTFFGKMLVNTQIGFIESSMFTESKFLARAEIRYNF